jgi:hypothetical protein
VLSYSRGYVEEFDVIASWEKDGLHYCRIRASVSREKLGEKLQTAKVALRAIPGQLFAGRIIQEQLSEEAAKQMFRQRVADFTPDKILKLAVAGKPEVDRTNAGAKLTIHYTVSANLEAWQNIHAGLKPFLTRVCLASTTAQYTNASPPHSYSGEWKMAGALRVKGVRGEDIVTYLYSDKSPEGNVTYYDTYLLPTFLEPEIRALAARHGVYRVRIALLDQADHVVAEAYARAPGLITQWNILEAEFLTSAIAPLPYASWAFAETKEATHDFSLTVDQLERVAKCAATIEKRTPK